MNKEKNAQSRRDFVKQTSLVAGGLIAMPIFSKANYFAGADDVIKIPWFRRLHVIQEQ